MIALSDRFGHPMSESDLQASLIEAKSDNSIRKSQWAVNTFNEWLKARQSNGLISGLHVFKPLEDMTKIELNSQLKYFLFEVRKVNKDRYPSNSLRDLYQGIGYHLHQMKGKPFKLFSDSEFADARAALDAAMKLANREGVSPQGNGPATAISPDQEEQLWVKGILGSDNPKKLLNTIFYLSGKHFALRGGVEHRELAWGKHVQLRNLEPGEFLIYTSAYSKNYNGGLKQTNLKPKEVKVFSNQMNPRRCFVELYKIYAKLRPQNGKCEAFYLKPRVKYSDSSKWFDDVAVGHNSLTSMLKNICESGGIQGGNYVNHALKKTAATALRHCSDVQKRAITGNRSSLSVYENVTEADYKITSSILSNQPTSLPSTSSSSFTKTVKTVSQETAYDKSDNGPIHLQAPPNKKWKVEVDANTNILTITYQ